MSFTSFITFQHQRICIWEKGRALKFKSDCQSKYRWNQGTWPTLLAKWRVLWFVGFPSWRYLSFRYRFTLLRSKIGLHLLVLAQKTTCGRRPGRTKLWPFLSLVSLSGYAKPTSTWICLEKRGLLPLPYLWPLPQLLENWSPRLQLILTSQFSFLLVIGLIYVARPLIGVLGGIMTVPWSNTRGFMFGSIVDHVAALSGTFLSA